MQPNQPNPGYQPGPAPAPQPPQPQPQPQNPYGFIMDDAAPKKSSKLLSLLSGGSKKSRILIVVAGAFILLLIGWMLLSLLGSGNKAQNEKLLGLAQQQTEIIRLSKVAENSRVIRQSATKNLAINGGTIMESSRKDITNLLAKNKFKVKDKQLSLKQDSKTDAKLASATNNDTYDTTFTEIYKGLLVQYQRSLKDAFDTSKTKAEKEILQSSFNSVSLLLKE